VRERHAELGVRLALGATACDVCRLVLGKGPRLAVGGAVAGLALIEAMQRRLGFVGEVYKQEEAGRFRRLSKLCTAAGAALLATRGKQSRAAAIGGGALVLTGELALRWSVFRAGFQSARDPRYVVIPQRERLGRSESRSAS
jgi:hypothetical protein